MVLKSCSKVFSLLLIILYFIVVSLSFFDNSNTEEVKGKELGEISKKIKGNVHDAQLHIMKLNRTAWLRNERDMKIKSHVMQLKNE